MSDRWLKLFLRIIGIVTLLAFGAAVMPQRWIVEVAGFLGFEPFPFSPLTFYLARNLSLLYGFVGCLLLLIAADFERYRPLVGKIGLGTIVFGGLQGVVDIQSAMPMWWTAYESLSTIFGGIIIIVLDHKTASGSRE